MTHLYAYLSAGPHHDPNKFTTSAVESDGASTASATKTVPVTGNSFNLQAAVENKEREQHREDLIAKATLQNKDFVGISSLDEIELLHIPSGSNIKAQLSQKQQLASPELVKQIYRKLQMQLIAALKQAEQK